MAVLSDGQVDAALPDLPRWEPVNGGLHRSIQFPAFLDGTVEDGRPFLDELAAREP